MGWFYSQSIKNKNIINKHIIKSLNNILDDFCVGDWFIALIDQSRVLLSGFFLNSLNFENKLLFI